MWMWIHMKCVCINDTKLKIQFILILIIVWLKFNRIIRKGIIGIDLLHKFIQFTVDEDFPPQNVDITEFPSRWLECFVKSKIHLRVQIHFCKLFSLLRMIQNRIYVKLRLIWIWTMERVCLEWKQYDEKVML